jgi:hypothetical protein
MLLMAFLRIGTALAFGNDCLSAFGHKTVDYQNNGKGGWVMIDHILAVFVVVVAMAFVTWLRWARKVKAGRTDHFLP